MALRPCTDYTIYINETHISSINILIFLFFISSTCFEPEGSSSGIRLYIKLRYGKFNMHLYKQSHVEDIKKLKIKILIWEMSISLVYIVTLHYNARCKKHETLYGLWPLTGTKLRLSRHPTSSLNTKITVLLSPLYGLTLLLFKTVSLNEANGSTTHVRKEITSL